MQRNEPGAPPRPDERTAPWARSGLPPPRYDHLIRMTSRHGVWEHAKYDEVRTEHGLCTDDNARALIVVSRPHSPTRTLINLAARYLMFLLDARTPEGGFHNRRHADGSWLDDVGSDDSQGRALWALGFIARHGPQRWMRRAGLDAFKASDGFTSVHLRANAFAVLGGVEVLAMDPQDAQTRALVGRAVEPIVEAVQQRFPWPEKRLTYDNARLPTALLAAGTALHDPKLLSLGTRLLTWLVGVETRGDRFSFTGTDGWAPGEDRPVFDQQPVEAAAMVEACHRAWKVTGEQTWRVHTVNAARWFHGFNDTGCVVYDDRSGGSRDGLMADGVNENLGAESTLAGLAALQVAASCAVDVPGAGQAS